MQNRNTGNNLFLNAPDEIKTKPKGMNINEWYQSRNEWLENQKNNPEPQQVVTEENPGTVMAQVVSAPIITAANPVPTTADDNNMSPPPPPPPPPPTIPHMISIPGWNENGNTAIFNTSAERYNHTRNYFSEENRDTYMQDITIARLGTWQAHPSAEGQSYVNFQLPLEFLVRDDTAIGISSVGEIQAVDGLRNFLSHTMVQNTAVSETGVSSFNTELLPILERVVYSLSTLDINGNLEPQLGLHHTEREAYANALQSLRNIAPDIVTQIENRHRDDLGLGRDDNNLPPPPPPPPGGTTTGKGLNQQIVELRQNLFSPDVQEQAPPQPDTEAQRELEYNQKVARVFADHPELNDYMAWYNNNPPPPEYDIFPARQSELLGDIHNLLGKPYEEATRAELDAALTNGIHALQDKNVSVQTNPEVVYILQDNQIDSNHLIGKSAVIRVLGIDYSVVDQGGNRAALHHDDCVIVINDPESVQRFLDVWNTKERTNEITTEIADVTQRITNNDEATVLAAGHLRSILSNPERSSEIEPAGYQIVFGEDRTALGSVQKSLSIIGIEARAVDVSPDYNINLALQITGREAEKLTAIVNLIGVIDSEKVQAKKATIALMDKMLTENPDLEIYAQVYRNEWADAPVDSEFERSYLIAQQFTYDIGIMVTHHDLPPFPNAEQIQEAIENTYRAIPDNEITEVGEVGSRRLRIPDFSGGEAAFNVVSAHRLNGLEFIREGSRTEGYYNFLEGEAITRFEEIRGVPREVDIAATEQKVFDTLGTLPGDYENNGLFVLLISPEISAQQAQELASPLRDLGISFNLIPVENETAQIRGISLNGEEAEKFLEVITRKLNEANLARQQLEEQQSNQSPITDNPENYKIIELAGRELPETPEAKINLAQELLQQVAMLQVIEEAGHDFYLRESTRNSGVRITMTQIENQRDETAAALTELGIEYSRTQAGIMIIDSPHSERLESMFKELQLAKQRTGERITAIIENPDLLSTGDDQQPISITHHNSPEVAAKGDNLQYTYTATTAAVVPDPDNVEQLEPIEKLRIEQQGYTTDITGNITFHR